MATKTVRKSKPPARTYTDADREAFLAQWELNARNTKRTCRQLNIPKSTAIGWIRRLEGDEHQPVREDAKAELIAKCYSYAGRFLDIMLAKAKGGESLHAVVGAFIKAVEHGQNLELGRLQQGPGGAQAGASVLVGVKSEQQVSLSGMSTDELNARLAGILGRLGQSGAAVDPRGVGATAGSRLG